MKNVLYYETGSGFGGSSNSVANLIKWLDREKYKPVLAVKHFSPNFDGIQNCDIIELKTIFRCLKKPIWEIYIIINGLLDIVRLYLLIKKRNIALVHVNVNPMPGLWAIIASGLAEVPCVCHLRQTRRLIKREKMFMHWVSKFIVINKKAYDIYRQDIPEDKLILVYNGLYPDEFLNVEHNGFLRREMNLGSSAIVGMVGRIVKGKGQKEFILAAKEVLKTKPNAKFIIVGGSNGANNAYFKEVQQLLKDEGMEGKIVFTGWRKDVKNIIADLNILIQATTTFPEGFGLTIIEAMALSKPVIATDIPGPSDIVENGKTGLLVPAGDVKEMAKRMVELLDNPDKAAAMGKEGRHRVEELFDIREKVKEIEKIYEKAINNKAGKVSILIPTRYDSRYIIELALKSIKKNTAYSDYEIIVCDCGVDQDTRAFLEDYAKEEEIKIITATNPTSPDDDLVNAVSSDYFVLMHDDIQVLKKDWLARRMRLMVHNKNNAIIGTIVNNFSNGKRFFTLGLLVKTEVSRKLGLKWSKQIDKGLDTGGAAYQTFFAQDKFMFGAYKSTSDIRHFAKMSWPIRKIHDGKDTGYLRAALKSRTEKVEEIRTILTNGIY